MPTYLQSLQWTTPDPYTPPSINPQAATSRVLSLSAFTQQLLTGIWSAFSPCIIWFEWSGGNRTNVPFASWTATMQTQLYERYVYYIKDYVPPIEVGGVRVVPAPTPADPPLTNIGSTASAIDPVSAVSPADAFALFVDLVGHSLAVEQLGILPWSLTVETQYALQDLFDATRWFSTGGSATQYMLNAAVPCHAWTARKFMWSLGICNTRLETIGQVLRWCKNLNHRQEADTTGADATNGYQWAQDFFGYQGAPPVAVMLAGRAYSGTDPAYQAAFPGVMHWTSGCHATAMLIQNLLAAVNIPVFRVDYDNPAWTSLGSANIAVWGAHASCLFRNTGRVLSHGDLPYEIVHQWVTSTGDCDMLPFPAEALTVSAQEWLPMAFLPEALFTDIIEPPLARVAAQFLTRQSVIAYYQARKGGQPAGSSLPSFNNGGNAVGPTFWWWQGEAIGMGAKLEAIVAPYLSDPDMTRLQADLNAIPIYNDVAPTS
jgi:hypothetical protein